MRLVIGDGVSKVPEVEAAKEATADLDGWSLASVLMNATWRDWQRRDSETTWAVLLPNDVNEAALAADPAVAATRLVHDVPEALAICRRVNPEDAASVGRAEREMVRRSLIAEEQMTEHELIRLATSTLLLRLDVPHAVRFLRLVREREGAIETAMSVFRI
jgi:hypothetical protein